MSKLKHIKPCFYRVKTDNKDQSGHSKSNAYRVMFNRDGISIFKTSLTGLFASLVTVRK